MEAKESREKRIQEAIGAWHKKWDKPKAKRLSYHEQRQAKRHYIKLELRKAK